MLYLSIHGVNVLIETAIEELKSLLKKDFSYFVVPSPVSSNMGLALSIKKETYTHLIPKNLVAKTQSHTCLSYQVGELRYNDYYGEALAIFNYAHETCELYGENIDRLHEVAFLIILSRVGLMHDKIGIHRLHAFALTYHDVNLVGMMPMKGGKSTLFMNLIKNPSIEILSDDSPLIDQKGEILPFPIRIGLQNKPTDYPSYVMHRKEYGEKFLVDVGDLGKKIGSYRPYTVLFQGKRSTLEQTQIIHCPKIRMLGYLFRNMIVGLGLPMVIEYFLVGGFEDKIEKAKISWNRFMSSMHLLMNSDCYIIHLTSNPDLNVEAIMKFLDEQFPHEKVQA